ncbi:MAG: VCBS repeat-containing protein [Aquirufa sp.]
MMRKLLAGFLLYFFIVACSNKKESLPLFRLLNSDQTGLDFSNDLIPNNQKNIFTYMYFYNGGGIGAGDLNNDGLIDVCYTSNLGENKLFINQGKLKFKDVSKQSNFNQNKTWSNGVSIVDINQDGLLDIYVSQAAGFDFLKGHNLLYVCQGITKDGVPIYSEKSQEFGLDVAALGTQAAFFDQDLDGDLDCFLLNHSVHQNGTFGFRSNFQGKFHPLAGDRYLENKGGKYVDKTAESGIISDVLGYGLGLAVSDINLDGYPDMYIGNDFHENDYLYINNQKGGFSENLEKSMMHTSQFSMGIDIADINSDAYPEIISLDMLPNDREILKRSEGEDSYNIFQYKIRQGYNHQFARNNLQFNRGSSGKFSEIGLMSGVYATDWSWSPLFFDFQNDGLRDLFISNGIPKRMNDIDYIQFVSNEEVQKKIEQKKIDENDLSLSDLLPEIKLPNRFFTNQGDLKFEDAVEQIEGNENSFSNGAIYADLDNDGDLDVVTNNINQKSFVYENLSPFVPGKSDYLRISLKGPQGNLNAIGAKVWVFSKDGLNVQQKFPVRGFQSSMEIPMHMGLGNAAKIDSIVLVWPDNTFQKINPKSDLRNLKIVYRKNLPTFNYKQYLKSVESSSPSFKEITQEVGLDFVHQENNYNEFDREALIPHLASAEGPALAVGDLNADGLEDVFLGGARDQIAGVFLQNKSAKFVKNKSAAIENDQSMEDVDAIIADFTGDHRNDLFVLSGGNEFSGNSAMLSPRLYLNQVAGLQKNTYAFPGIFVNGSKALAFDFNKDGFLDIVIGGRAIPFEYGNAPRSYFLKNDGKGNFTDVTFSMAPEFKNVGMVRNLELVDIDKDHDLDIIAAVEWEGILCFENKSGKFKKKEIGTEKGWWTATKTIDVDLDGDLDIIAGNLGQNARLKPNAEFPVRLYIGDFDANQKMDQVLSYYLGSEEIPFANKMEMEKQFPIIKKEFIYARDFAKARIKDFMGGKFLSGKVLEATDFSSKIWINDGHGKFESHPLPVLAQLSPILAIQEIDLNHDSLPDFILGGNFYPCNIQMGRYDADYGTIMINKGKGKFEIKTQSMLNISGQIRHISPIHIKDKTAYIFAKNNESVQVLTWPK